MDHQNNNNNNNVQSSSEEMNLVLSTDAKPRLKWTPQLHQRFIDAVFQLGGPEKATPKSLMRLMGIPGLTLYHLKSHLQKYRLGKNQQQSENCKEVKQENVETKDNLNHELNLFTEGNKVNDTCEEDQIQENAHIAQAMQLQMEVQRKLHEQLEVQRHLQLRIEAQGKYLQKVLKKAHETLSIYNCPTLGVENAKAELSQLVSMVSTPSFSELTETQDLSSLDDHLNLKRLMRPAGCSVESSLTSSESSESDDCERDTAEFGQETSPLIMSLLDKDETRGLQLSSRKRSRSTSCEGIFVQEKSTKKSKQVCKDELGLKKFGPRETFDLNSQCEIDLNLGSNKQTIDLNLII